MGAVCCAERESDQNSRQKNKLKLLAKSQGMSRVTSFETSEKRASETTSFAQSAYESDISYRNTSIRFKYFIVTLQYISDNLISHDHLKIMKINEDLVPKNKSCLIAATLCY